ncbi:MAG: hypothetical protein PHU08_00295 [Dehalococcoidales bacterium]|nr:hypothetical protein [Dehalococcoidales bacterium]
MKTKKNESIKLIGRWKLTARNRFTGEVITKEGGNLVTTVGKQLVGDMLIDRTGYDTGLTYCAIGSDNTAPAITDTTLTVEEARKAITSRTRAGNDITLSTFFTAAEATYAIEEAGVFGHSTASAAADSGVLASHFLVSFDNTGGLYDITVQLTWTIG